MLDHVSWFVLCYLTLKCYCYLDRRNMINDLHVETLLFAVAMYDTILIRTTILDNN